MPNIVIALGGELNENTAPGSRALRIGEVLEKNGFDIEFFSINNGMENFFTSLLSNYKLAKKVALHASNNQALVISRGVYLNIFLALYSFRKNFIYGIDLHCQVEGIIEWFFNKKYIHIIVFGPLSIFSILQSSFIIGITPAICSYNARVYDKETFLIPNGIDIEKIRKIIDKNYKSNLLENNVRYIFFIGHQEPWIPLEDLLYASEHMEDFRVVIIGEIPSYEKYSIQYPKAIFLGKLTYVETMNLANNYSSCFYHSFLKNDIWKYKSSRKLLEYLFFEKPIILNTKNYLDSELEKFGCFRLYRDGDAKNLAQVIEFTTQENGKNSENNLVFYSWVHLIKKSGLVSYLKISISP